MFTLPRYPLCNHPPGLEGSGPVQPAYQQPSEETSAKATSEVPFKRWRVKNADSESSINDQQRAVTGSGRSLAEIETKPISAHPTAGLNMNELDGLAASELEQKQADLLKQADNLFRTRNEKKLVGISLEELKKSQANGPEKVLDTLRSMDFPPGLKVKITLKSQPDTPLSLIPPGDELESLANLPRLMTAAIQILEEHDQTKLKDFNDQAANSELNTIRQSVIALDNKIAGQDTDGQGKGAQAFDRLKDKKYEIIVHQLTRTVETRQVDANPVAQPQESGNVQPLPEPADAADLHTLTSSQALSEENVQGQESKTDSTDTIDSIYTAVSAIPQEEADQTPAPDSIPYTPDNQTNKELPPLAISPLTSDPVEAEVTVTPALTQGWKETIPPQTERGADILSEEIVADFEKTDNDISTTTKHSVTAHPASVQEKITPMVQVQDPGAVPAHTALVPPPAPPPPSVQQAKTIVQPEKTAKKGNPSPEGNSNEKRSALISELKSGNFNLNPIKLPADTLAQKGTADGTQEQIAPPSDTQDVSKKNDDKNKLQEMIGELSGKLQGLPARTPQQVEEMEREIDLKKKEKLSELSRVEFQFQKELQEKANTGKRPTSKEIDQKLAEQRKKDAAAQENNGEIVNGQGTTGQSGKMGKVQADSPPGNGDDNGDNGKNRTT